MKYICNKCTLEYTRWKSEVIGYAELDAERKIQSWVYLAPHTVRDVDIIGSHDCPEHEKLREIELKVSREG